MQASDLESRLSGRKIRRGGWQQIAEVNTEYLRNREDCHQPRVGGRARPRLAFLELLVCVPAQVRLVSDTILTVAASHALTLDVRSDGPGVGIPLRARGRCAAHLPRFTARLAPYGLIGMAICDHDA